MLVLAVSVNLHELLEDRSLAAIASLRELRGVVVMAVDMAIVLVVTVLSAEDSGTKGACEVVDVILSVESSDVGASEGAATFVAKQAQPAEVVCLAKRVLSLATLVVDREELGSYNLTAVTTLEAVQMKGPVQGAHELAGQRLSTLFADSLLAAG